MGQRSLTSACLLACSLTQAQTAEITGFRLSTCDQKKCLSLASPSASQGSISDLMVLEAPIKIELGPLSLVAEEAVYDRSSSTALIRSNERQGLLDLKSLTLSWW